MDRRPTPEKLVAIYIVTGALFLLVAAWLFGAIAEDVINHDAFLGGIDRSVAAWLHAHATPGLTGAMTFVSYLGAPLASVFVSCACAFVLWRRRRYYALAALVLAVPCGMLLNVLMKNVVQRPRPTFPDPIVTLATYSFPSGHALGSTLLYGLLAVIVVWTVKNRRVRLLVVCAALFLIALICFSRIYLGVHYLSDVVAGFLAGLFWLGLCLFTVATFRRRRWQRDSRNTREPHDVQRPQQPRQP